MKLLITSILLFYASLCTAQTYFTNYRTIRDLKLNESTSKEYKLNKFTVKKDAVEWFVGNNLVPMEFKVIDIDNATDNNITTYKTINPKGNIMYFLINKESIALISEVSDQMYVYSIYIKG